METDLPRLVFVVSLHHVGRQLTGIMAATAFAQIAGRQVAGQEDSEEPGAPDLLNCALEAFTFTSEDDAKRVEPRVKDWIEEALGVALRHWSGFIS